MKKLEYRKSLYYLHQKELIQVQIILKMETH